MSKSGFPWNSLARLLTKAHSWTGQQTFSNINITGGSITGAVTTLPMATSTNPGVSAATTVTIVDANSGVIILQNDGSPAAQTIGSPTVVTAGKIFTVVNNDTSVDNVVVNGFTVTPGEAQSFIWDGSAWGPTDLGITSIPVPITQGGTGASTAATAFTNIKQAATTSTSGVTVYSGTTKALAGTDTASAMTPADTAAKVAVDVNPKAMSQGVAMTYAASGSTGITVADNDNIDFGTGNFTLVWKGSLPDWTPSGIDIVLFSKSTSKVNFLSTDVGYLRLQLGVTAGVTSYTSSVANGFIDSTAHDLVVVVTRETTSVDGSVVFYVDGLQFGTSRPIAAQVVADLSNTSPAYIQGSSSVHYASTTHHAYTFNRALTAAEVLDLYRNGIAYADKWGSQTPIYTSNFSAGVDGWTATNGTIAGNIDGIGGEDDWLRLTVNTALIVHRAVKASFLTAGKKYKYSLKYFIPSTNNVMTSATLWNHITTIIATLNVTDTATTISGEFTAMGDSLYVYGLTGSAFQDAGGDDVFYIKDVVITEIGATLALESPGIQPAPGQWLDSSSNKLHAMQPATGSTLTRSKKDFEYRWTNTWTASSAAQYVGGLNQAVLSADHFITDIITQATETTDVENLTLGDGSDADRFVTAFAPSATRTSQTIAAQNDGTNLKLVYTPAAEATMTVETIIRGFIWEP